MHMYTLPRPVCLYLKALILSSLHSSLSMSFLPVRKENPGQSNIVLCGSFMQNTFIETNNSRGRNKLRGVIGKRENICFQLQFKMKCSVDKTENTAGRTFLTEESAQAALTS